jgi:hypothetical protein
MKELLIAMVCLAACTAMAQAAPKSSGAPERAVVTKMEQTIIPEINFREAKVDDVVAFLREASRENDPTPAPAAKKEVNFVLNLRSGATSDVTEASMPLLTFKARDISLLEALNMVTQLSGLKYRVEGHVVMIVPVGAPDGPIVTRSYAVMPSVSDKALKVQQELK